MPKPTLLRIGRRFSLSPGSRKYAKQTGEVLLAWNKLHAYLQMLFGHLAFPTDVETGYAIWHAAKSDATQRAMLRAAVRRLLPPGTPLSAGLEWLIEAAERLSSHRNDAAHVPVDTSSWSKRLADPDKSLGDPKRVARLTGKEDLGKFYRMLNADLHHFSEYAIVLGLEMTEPGRYGPLPRSPKLRAVSFPRELKTRRRTVAAIRSA